MMPITIYWDYPATYRLILEISTPMTWDELLRQTQEAHRLIAESSQVIDLIVWTVGEPPEGSILRNLRKVLEQQPANVGQVLIVTDAASTTLMFVQRIATALRSLFPQKSRVQFVQSLEEARRRSNLGRNLSA